MALITGVGASWLVFTLVLGWAIGAVVGMLLVRLLPPGQRLIPPRVARNLVVLASLVFVLPTGCRTGSLAMSVAAGDRLAEVDAPSPWPTHVLSQQVVRNETRELLQLPRTARALTMVVVRVMLDGWADVIAIGWPIIVARRHSESFAGAWINARPQTILALQRAAVATYLVTFALAALSAILLFFVFLILRFEVRRARKPSGSS